MRRIAISLIAMAALLIGAVVAAGAVTTTGFAQWGTITGTTGDYATTMQLPAIGFPRATLATDSRADVALPSGATNWFGENTPPGLRYGSSRDQAYINLRPRADNATSPSTSTYTFDRATPTGWTFVLGDIDSDQVAVSATRADGTPATPAELGFRTAFNLCATTPRPSSVCSTTSGRPQDVPTWNPATATLRGNDGALDSDGATGWFEPTVPLRTLTFTFTRRAGFPIFQTWFAVTKQDVAGTVSVSAGTCDLTGATVSLLDRSGTVVATRAVGVGGAYSFAGVAASDGYRAALGGLPDACIPSGPSTRAIDLRAGDAVADFAVREVIPVPISGQVTGDGGPLEGVTVTLTSSAGGASRTTTTDVDGRYVFDNNPDATTYTIAVTPPAGYLLPDVLDVPIPDGATIPIGDQDFVLQALPSVSGIVEDVDGPVAGVTVELTGGGQIYRAVTGADGTYVLPRLPAGDYSLTVPDPPAGYQPAPVRPVAVRAADVSGQDLVLTRVPATGSVAGLVTLDGSPVAGVVVTIRPPGGTGQDVTTDAQGTYGLGGLAPGAYEIVVTPAAGTTGAAPRTVTITSLGEEVLGQDFALTTAATPPTPTPTPTPDPADPGTPSDDPDDPGTSPGDDGGVAQPASGVLPDAGGPAVQIPLLGLGLLVAGGITVAAARPRRS